MRKPRTPLIFAFAVVVCGAAQAATFGPSSLEPGAFVVRDIIHPLAAQSITQNIDPNVLVAGTSVACASGGVTTDNHWWRLFNLDDDHLLTGTMTVANVDYGIETAVGPEQNLMATSYCLDEGLPFLFAFLTQVGTNSIPQPDAELEFFNISVGGSCDTAIQDLAVDLHSQDCLNGEANCVSLFIGMNDLGEIGPTYIHAEDCSIFDPIELQSLGFVDAYLVMVVNGEADGGEGDGGVGDDGGDDQVPASTGAGVTLMVLALLGSSAYFLGRHAKS